MRVPLILLFVSQFPLSSVPSPVPSPLPSTPSSSSAVTAFKIVGERNTGTRYLKQLLQLNLQVPHLQFRVNGRNVEKLTNMSEAEKDNAYASDPSFFGWKHACAPTLPQLIAHDDDAETSAIATATLLLKQPLRVPANRILFVVIGKNPYSWLLSMWRHPYNRMVSAEQRHVWPKGIN